MIRGFISMSSHEQGRAESFILLMHEQSAIVEAYTALLVPNPASYL